MSLNPTEAWTRRRLLQGTAAVAVTTAVSSLLPVEAAEGNPQPALPAGMTAAAVHLTVTTTHAGTLPAGLVGLSPGKADLTSGKSKGVPDPPYSASNTAIVRLLKLLAPEGGTLRIGQGTEDTTVWDKAGKGGVHRRMDPVDIEILVNFLKNSGWKVIYGINLGGMAPKGNNPPLTGTQTPTSPEDAAEEVECLVTTMMKVMGRQKVSGQENWLNYLTGIEIGNEPDLEGWHADHAFCVPGVKASGNELDRSKANRGCRSTIGQWTESGQPAPWGFEETWEVLRTAVVGVGKKLGVTIPMTGPGTTGVFAKAEEGKPAVNNPDSWTDEFAKHKGSEVSVLTYHYYAQPTTLYDLLLPDRLLIGPNPKPTAPLPAQGVLGMLYEDSATTLPVAHMYGLTECNTRGGKGKTGICNAYASALWVIDFLFAIAQGYVNGEPSGGHGGRFACLNAGDFYSLDPECPKGGGNYYSPLYYRNDRVVGVMPMFYGMMLVGNHCGPGEIYATQAQTDGDLNLSTYAVQSARGGLKLVVVNKDFKANSPLQVKADLPSAYRNAELIVLTQGPGGSTVPDLGVYPKTIGQDVDVTLQGTKLGLDGSYKPMKPYTLTPVGKTVRFTVPPLSAVVVTLN